MKINRFFSGLVGLVLAACGPDDPSKTDSGNEGGYTDASYDAGQDSGYDGGQSDGGNQGPVVIIEAKDDQGNVKTEFNVGETVHWNINKSYDPDCQTRNECEGVGTYLPQCDKGIDYCRREESTGSSGLFFPGVELVVSYGSSNQNQSIRFHVKCFDLETKEMDESTRPFGESTYNIIIK